MAKRSIEGIKSKGAEPAVKDVEDEADQKEDVKKQKMTFGFTKTVPKLGNKPKAINMKLPIQKAPTVPPLKNKLHNVFNADSDESEEEMPPEARMRMRNIGRETPTSAGPNSFGKTKQGFCDAKSVFEKKLKKAALEQSGDAEPKKGEDP